MQKRIYAAVLFLLLVVITANANPFRSSKKPNWHDKYVASGTLGAELETDFGKLLGTCGVIGLDSKSSQYSAIPNILQTALRDDLTKPVHALNGPSSAMLFRYVFPQRNLDVFKAVDPSKVLPATFFDMSDVPTPVKGMSSKIYSQTCASILAAAVNVDLKPPSVSIQAALNNQYRGNNSVALVSGTFYSPLYGVLSDPGNGTDRLAALLALWQYYRANPTTITTPLFYVSGYNGMAVFFVSGRSMSQDYDVKASGSGNWLVASMDAKLGADLKEESKLAINDYVTIASKTESNEDDVAFRQLPTPTDISAEFSHRTAVFKPVAEDYVRQKAPFRYYFELRGVPDAMCQPNLWTITASATTVTYEGAKFDAGACRFFARYEAPDDLKNVPAVLTHTIKSVDSIGSNELAITASFRPVTTEHPVPTVADFQKRPAMITSPTGDRTLRWTIPVRFIDAQDPVQLTLRPPQVVNATLACGGTSSDIVATAVADPSNAGMIITVDRRLVPNEIVDQGKERDCSFGSSVMVALGPTGTTQRNAVRAVNTSLSIPLVSVPVTPAASPMSPAAGMAPSSSSSGGQKE